LDFFGIPPDTSFLQKDTIFVNTISCRNKSIVSHMFLSQSK